MTTMKQEQRILEALISELGAAGYQPAAVWIEDGYVLAQGEGPPVECEGEVPNSVHRALTATEVCKVFEDYDLYAPTVHFTEKGSLRWGRRGVMVVPGNGQDFVSDWHCSDQDFNAVVDRVSMAASEEAFA